MAQNEVQPFEWKWCKIFASVETNLSCGFTINVTQSTTNIKPELLWRFVEQGIFPQIHKCHCLCQKCPLSVQFVPGGWVCSHRTAWWSTREFSAELGTPECPHSGDPGRTPDPLIVQSISPARSLHSSVHSGPHQDWKHRCGETISAG